MFDKVKAVLHSTVLVAGAAAVTSLAGVDWSGVLSDVPGPDFVKAAATVVIVGAINWAAAFFRREKSGYGGGVLPPPAENTVDVPPV